MTVMRRFDRSDVQVACAAAAALGLYALGLRAGGVLAIATIGLLAVISILVIARITLRAAGVGAAMASAFTLPWNGWLVGPVRPGDLLLLIALACLVAAEVGEEFPSLPWWVSQLGVVILVVAVEHEFWPTNPKYLLSRIILGSDGLPMIENQTNLGVAAKFLVAVLAIPYVFALCAKHYPRALRWIAISYAAGVALSALVAFSDGLGLTDFGFRVTHVAYGRAREAGFSIHPNFLAGACVLSISTAVWLLASYQRRDKIIGAVLMPCLLAGTYATGSRGGAVCVVLAVGITVVLIPRFRRHLVTIALAALTLAAAVLVLVPSLGSAILKATRLSGNTQATQGSDLARSLVGAQGLHDFEHSPVFGIGLQVAAEAQNVYLQEVASGGVVLFAAMLVYTFAAARLSFLAMRYDDLARPLLATVLAGIVFNGLEASLTDRFSYVSFGILVALVSRQRTSEERTSEASPDIGADVATDIPAQVSEPARA